MHECGDRFGYFEEVEQAAYEIGGFCSKWGRIRVTQTKEKWGTARVYCSLGWYELGSLLSPRTCYYGHWPRWLKWVWRVHLPIWFSTALRPYQIFIYRLAYKKAVRKYPFIRQEILIGADYPGYLKSLMKEARP